MTSTRPGATPPRRDAAAAVIVWDLDGTVYRGTAACRHYARGVAETLDEARRAPYLEAVERYLAGGGGVDAADGWEAAVLLAGGARGASRAFGDAFARTRAFMLTEACELEVPDGLHEFLAGGDGSVRHMLASNTPAFGVMPLLARLDLLDAFDEISCDSAKPRGFERRLRAAAEIQGLPPRSVLSVGDHFVNDIEPALEAGCATAYLDPFGVGPRGRADLESRRLEDLLGPLEEWGRERATARPEAVAG